MTHNYQINAEAIHTGQGGAAKQGNKGGLEWGEPQNTKHTHSPPPHPKDQNPLKATLCSKNIQFKLHLLRKGQKF